jgi:hypothetical protein
VRHEVEVASGETLRSELHYRTDQALMCSQTKRGSEGAMLIKRIIRFAIGATIVSLVSTVGATSTAGASSGGTVVTSRTVYSFSGDVVSATAMLHGVGVPSSTGPDSTAGPDSTIGTEWCVKQGNTTATGFIWASVCVYQRNDYTVKISAAVTTPKSFPGHQELRYKANTTFVHNTPTTTYHNTHTYGYYVTVPGTHIYCDILWKGSSAPYRNLGTICTNGTAL